MTQEEYEYEERRFYERLEEKRREEERLEELAYEEYLESLIQEGIMKELAAGSDNEPSPAHSSHSAASIHQAKTPETSEPLLPEQVDQ